MIPHAATKWYQLGLELIEQQYQYALDIIEADTPNDVSKCCKKMFQKWFETDKQASWDKLIKALRIFQLDNVANDVENFLQAEYVTNVLMYLDIYII